VLPYMTKRLARLSLHDVALLIRDCVHPNLDTGKKDGTFFTAMSQDAQVKLAAIGSGCTVVVLHDEDAVKYEEALGERFAVVTWHGTSSMQALVSADELSVLYNQILDSGLGCGVDKEYEERKAAKEAAEALDAAPKVEADVAAVAPMEEVAAEEEGK
jgi:hypothetical protein